MGFVYGPKWPFYSCGAILDCLGQIYTGCGPYLIHGPARLAFKWKENVKRKCGLIFEFWKIRPQGGTVLLWSRHLLLFLFYKGKTK